METDLLLLLEIAVLIDDALDYFQVGLNVGAGINQYLVCRVENFPLFYSFEKTEEDQCQSGCPSDS